MVKNAEEFANFDNTMRKLISVPHSEIKAKLEAEKIQKQKQKKKQIKKSNGEK